MASPDPLVPSGPLTGTKTRVILVGVGGATCSGKTTLAKHLRSILPDSVIIHQDDFAPPAEKVPFHPIHNMQDWDAAPSAIDWPRLISFLRHFKEAGEIPPNHKSHDHLNEQKTISLSQEARDKWHAVFERIHKEKAASGERIIWGLVDGFLLYWHQEVIDLLSIRLFLRVPYDVLKQRRHERNGYHTAEGALWWDPPDYWENIVFPAYVEANRHLFVNGDLEHGTTSPDGVKNLVVIEGLEISMEEMVEKCCEILRREVEEHPCR